jgi:hypothetical protein
MEVRFVPWRPRAKKANTIICWTMAGVRTERIRAYSGRAEEDED